MMFSLLINGEEKGNMLLLICVNLRTHTQPAAVRISLGISSAVNQTHLTPRGRSSLRRKQDLGFRREAGCRAELAGWLQARALPASLEQFPHPAELPWLVTHTWMGLQAAQPSWGHRASSCLCRGDTLSQSVPLGFGTHMQAR